MGHMRFEDTKPYEDWFWKKNRINLLQDRVKNVDFSGRTLQLSNGKLEYDKLIIAVGSKSNKFGWPGQNLEGVSGLYHLQDLQNMEKFSKGLQKAVIVGGGLIGIEMAEMFHSRNIPVTMLVRESSYWDNVLPEEESIMVTEEIRKNHIDLKLESNLQEIIDGGNGKVAGVIVKESGEKIDCGYVGLTPGVSPNVAFLKNTDLNIEKGIVVNNYLETNMEDVYAIGDCAQLSDPLPGRKSIEAVWYTGRMMGETVAYNIMDKQVTYDPGIWFNSAKFINIEYQVYGYVPNQEDSEVKHLFWKNEDNNKSIRIVYDAKHKYVRGFNLMGIRYRHEVCEKWLAEKTSIEEVLVQLSLANFDPEFYDSYDQQLVDQYNKDNETSITIKSKRRLSKVLEFLGK
jgi:NADPH-dependent 2,4-dienoyl-CoA reductase/sulfur reductase-like enzyme